jgi:hypothetical protein
MALQHVLERLSDVFKASSIVPQYERIIQTSGALHHGAPAAYSAHNGYALIEASRHIHVGPQTIGVTENDKIFVGFPNPQTAFSRNVAFHHFQQRFIASEIGRGFIEA